MIYLSINERHANDNRRILKPSPRCGNNGRFATLQGAPHRWWLPKATDEGAKFAGIIRLLAVLFAEAAHPHPPRSSAPTVRSTL